MNEPMNLSQISAFHAVMTSETLTDAASKLGRTQPAVSAAIKSLEDQLGLQLFERKGRKLVPVPEAQYLLTEASAILSQMSRIRMTMRGLAEGQSGNLSLAAMPGPVSMLFPKFIAEQIDGDSEVKVSMFARSSHQIAELVRAQSIDFGFADLPDGTEGESLYQVEIITGDCFVAVPTTHPLAALRKIALADLDGEPMGSLQANHAHQRDVRSAFQARGLTFSARMESQTFLPILQFVIAGQCCSILDPLTVVHVNAAGFMSDSIAVRPLVEPIQYRYAIFSPRHRPVSIMAARLRAAWSKEVVRLLKDVGANPSIVDAA